MSFQESMTREFLSFSINPGETLGNFFTRYDNLLWACADSCTPLPDLQHQFHVLLRALALPMTEQQHLLCIAGDSPTIGGFQRRITLYIGEKWQRFPPIPTLLHVPKASISGAAISHAHVAANNPPVSVSGEVVQSAQSAPGDQPSSPRVPRPRSSPSDPSQWPLPRHPNNTRPKTSESSILPPSAKGVLRR